MAGQLLRVGVFLAIALVAIPGAIVATWSGDPPIDDADLTVPLADVAAPKNGFVRLRDAGSAWWPEERSELEALWTDSWDAPLVVEVLARNGELLEAVPAILAAPHFQVPAEPDATLGTDLARLLAIRSRQHAANGRSEAAFQDALAAVRLGHRVQTARGGSLLTAITGIALKGVGLEAVRATLTVAEIDVETARRWTDALRPLGSDPEAGRETWAFEYREMAAAIDETSAGTWAEQFGGESTALVGSSYLFKPNATKALFAGIYRSWQRGSGGTCREMRPPEVQRASGRLAQLRSILAPNGVGRILFEVAAPDFTRFEMRRCATDTELDATRALVALRAWEREYGTLPAELEGMVPELLADRPLDAFDGAPLRYDAAGRRLWSVGSDFADARGQTPPDDRLHLEPSWSIPF